MKSVDIDRTLERIAYRGSREPSLDTLRDLQHAFLMRVPFENLDIHLGHEISLSPDRVYEKIVTRRRGGFCYECNGLFTDLLTVLGFRVTVLSARMALGGAVCPEFDHMAMQVDLDAPYLVDVGNGQSCREPLRMDGSNENTSEGYTYRVGRHAAERALYWREDGADWAPRFLFSLTPRRRADFAGMCHYHQTSPESLFTRKRLITLATESGRVTLTDWRLVTTQDGRREEWDLASEAEYRTCLREQFGIEFRD